MDASKTSTPSLFPFPFMTSSPSTVFPMMPGFQVSPGFQQIYANFVQQQIMHMAQQQSPQLRTDHSPSLSDRTSSRTDSPSHKKLIVDETGQPMCPICGERLAENDWSTHVDMERERLSTLLLGVKSKKHCENGESSEEQTRRKRQLELVRIRNNQQKRLALKRGILHNRDSLTPFSRQSNEESGSSGSPEVKKEEDSFTSIKCSTCMRNCEYGIICSSLDSPKCQECFDSMRLRPALPASFQISCLLDVSLARSPTSSQPGSPPEKKIKVI